MHYELAGHTMAFIWNLSFTIPPPIPSPPTHPPHPTTPSHPRVIVWKLPGIPNTPDCISYETRISRKDFFSLITGGNVIHWGIFSPNTSDPGPTKSPTAWENSVFFFSKPNISIYIFPLKPREFWGYVLWIKADNNALSPTANRNAMAKEKRMHSQQTCQTLACKNKIPFAFSNCVSKNNWRAVI